MPVGQYTCRFHCVSLTKRKGWIRLGIVLSLAWFLGILIFAVLDFQTVQTHLTTSVKSGNPFVEGISEQTFFTNCNVKEKQVSCIPRSGSIALLSVVPVAIAWILIVTAVYAVLWIHAGFRG